MSREPARWQWAQVFQTKAGTVVGCNVKNVKISTFIVDTDEGRSRGDDWTRLAAGARTELDGNRHDGKLMTLKDSIHARVE